MVKKFAEMELPFGITVKRSDPKFLKEHGKNGEMDLVKFLIAKNWVGLNYNTEIWNRSIL